MKTGHDESARHALYRGVIQHRRFTPVSHHFRYGITMTMIDLDHADALFRPFPILGTRLPSLGWFRRKDYHGEEADSLRDHIRSVVRQHLGVDPRGRMLLLTHPR